MIGFAVIVGSVVGVLAACYGLGWFSCARHRRDAFMLLAVAALLFAPTLAAHVRAQGAPGGFPDLVAGLKATPGCLGVETARTSSGKQVIFAWFEDKKAALAWYYSDMHRAVMKQFTPPASPDQPKRPPLADVSDDGGPILAIASVTLVDPSQAPPGAPPFKQIAIELYRPLPGGVAFGGRFAPATLKVPGLRDIQAPQEKK